MTVARFSLGRVVLRLIAMLSDRAFRERARLSASSDHPVTVVNKQLPRLPARMPQTGANEWTHYVP
jgi:hypothetical protein